MNKSLITFLYYFPFAIVGGIMSFFCTKWWHHLLYPVILSVLIILIYELFGIDEKYRRIKRG